MRLLKFYFDTSVFSFAIANDVPKEKGVTLRLFKEVKNGKYGNKYPDGIQAHRDLFTLGDDLKCIKNPNH